jgi:hypothetical protein
MSPPSSGLRSKPSKKPAWSRQKIKHFIITAVWTSNPTCCSRQVHPKRRLTFSGLQDITAQNIEIFVIITLRTWKPFLCSPCNLVLCTYNLWIVNHCIITYTDHDPVEYQSHLLRRKFHRKSVLRVCPISLYRQFLRRFQLIAPTRRFT